MNTKDAIESRAIVTAIGRNAVADGGQAIRLRYVGSPESTPDYADAVLVSATSLVLSVNGVGDATVGSSGTLAFATYTTLGALVDAINVSSNWEAFIVAGLRTDAVNGSEMLARSTATFRPWTEVALYWDSSDGGVLGVDIALEPTAPFQKDGPEHRVGFKQLLALVNTSAGETIQVYVYEVRADRAEVVRTLAQFAVTDNTAFDSGLNGGAVLAHADWGNSILVRFRGTGWVDTAAYLRVYGERQ